MTAELFTEGRRAPTIDRIAAVILEWLTHIPLPPRSTGRISQPQANLLLPAHVRDAIRDRIGPHAVAGAALARFAVDVFAPAPGPNATRLDRRAHWRRAIEVAAVAERLNTRSCAHDDPAALCTAALLHDVGQVAIDRCLPKTYARIRRESEHRRLNLSQLEWARLGLDHARVGHAVATRWNLTDSIAGAVASHHAHPGATGPATRDAAFQAKIQLASALTRRAPLGHPDRVDPRTIESLASRAGVPYNDTVIRREEPDRRAFTWIDALAPLLCDPARPSADASCIHRPPSYVPTRDRSVRGSRGHSPSIRCVTEFTRRLSSDDRPSTVCRHIVDCCAEVFEIEPAVAFSYDPERNLYACGVRIAGRTTHTCVVLADGATGRTDPLPRAMADRLARSIVPPPPMAEPVMERFRRILKPGATAMIPVVHDHTLLGGVLFNANNIADAHLTSCADGVEAIAAAFGAAVSQTDRRMRIERNRDALAASNRRLRADQTGLILAHAFSMLAETAAGAAHELNTPLAVIAARAQMLARSVGDPEHRRTLDTIRAHSVACSDIVNALMTFAKPDPPKPARIALESWFKRRVERCPTGAPKKPIDPIVQICDPATQVWADPQQFETILDAVIANAVEAVAAEGGRFIVNSRSRATDDTVVITIEDNGRGMTEDVLERACDPFFSHRSAGRGRGMGLSIARRLTEANHGRLWVESRPGAGTTVFVELPARNRSRGASCAQPGPDDACASEQDT